MEGCQGQAQPAPFRFTESSRCGEAPNGPNAKCDAHGMVPSHANSSTQPSSLALAKSGDAHGARASGANGHGSSASDDDGHDGCGRDGDGRDGDGREPRQR